MGEPTYRFLHAADLHLDSPLRGLAGYEQASVEVLRSATRRAFLRLVDHALERAVAFVVIAGDLYDGEWKEANTGHFFLQQVQRLGQRGVRVYVLHGNHDFQSALVRQLGGRLPENLSVFPSDTPATFEVPEVPVVLHGQSYPRRDVGDDLSRCYPPARPGRLNVGVLHTAADDTEHLPYAPCTVSGLASHGYGYWALGHVHQGRVLSRAPWIVFPGNLQGRHARETGPKGCVEVECRGEAVVEVTDVVLDVVRWHRLEVDLSGATTDEAVTDRFLDVIAPLVEENSLRHHAIRVRLSGATPMHGSLAARGAELRAQLSGHVAGRFPGVWLEKVLVETRPADASAAPPSELLALLARLAASEGPLVAAELQDLDDRLKPLARTFGDGEAAIGDLASSLPQRALALLAARLGVAQ